MDIRNGLLMILVVGQASLLAAEDKREDFFELRIRPVLAKSCFGCHSERKAESGLRVDSRESLMKGGDRGPSIVPKSPNKSLLIEAIKGVHDDLRMPPKTPLPKSVVRDFERWVEQGATWPDAKMRSVASLHWAWRPVASVALPPSVDGWSDHPIDRFIADGWKSEGLQRVERAEPRAQMRRVFFDLIGMPPTLAQIRDFEQAMTRAPDTAFPDLIDKLLASPHYGERWGRHWMDVVRYADTAGDNADYPIPEARLYRNYIIDAFNADLPFDQFLREQIAGDLLHRQETPNDRYAEQIAATGFLALGRRYGTAPYELWHLTLEDVIDTVGRATMGLTLKCARCHDHKFDPIPTDDYYALYGIFDSTKFPWAGGEEFQSKKTHRIGFVPLLPDDQAAPKAAAFKKQLDELAGRISELEQRLKGLDGQPKAKLNQQLEKLRADHFQRQRSGLPAGLAGAYAVRDGAPHDVRVHLAGDPTNAGDTIPRNGIAFLNGAALNIPKGQSGRLQLAEWIASADHPLTARVMVNRVWQQHFGRGIVATPSNFGTSGASPSHPELLDYLTARFIASGWSIKQMHRLILTSKTWRLASTNNKRNAAIDTGNRFYWRHDRRRLDAEAIRDAMFSVSGRLNLEQPGAHPFPPIKDWHWTQHHQFKDFYDSPHRSVYLMTPRLQRHPFLALFDGPDTNTTTSRRTSSTVTPQSLYLMNSSEVHGIAAQFSARLMKAKPKPDDRIQLAYRLCFARSATSEELQRATEYIRAYRERLLAEGSPSEEIDRRTWASYARILLSSAEFLYVD